MGTKYLSFQSAVNLTTNQCLLSNSSMITFYTYPQTLNLQKELGPVEIDNYVSSRFTSTYSSSLRTDLYKTFNTFELQNDKFELSRPLEYDDDFFSYFSKITLPLSSASPSSITNKYFYATYPYIKQLTPTYEFNIAQLQYSDILIIKDVYLPYNVNNQYLLLAPAYYFGQVGYRVFINNKMLILDNTSIQNIPTNYKPSYADLNNLQPIMTAYLSPGYNWFSNPANINYMFNIGRNRIAIELIYGNSSNYPYGDNNLCFQFDLIINNEYVVSSGLYTLNNPFQTKYGTSQNYSLNLLNDNTAYIYTDPRGFNNLSIYLVSDLTVNNGTFVESYNVSYLNWTLSYSGGNAV